MFLFVCVFFFRDWDLFVAKRDSGTEEKGHDGNNAEDDDYDGDDDHDGNNNNNDGDAISPPSCITVLFLWHQFGEPNRLMNAVSCGSQWAVVTHAVLCRFFFCRNMHEVLFLFFGYPSLNNLKSEIGA